MKDKTMDPLYFHELNISPSNKVTLGSGSKASLLNIKQIRLFVF